MSALLSALNRRDETELRNLLAARAPGSSFGNNEECALLTVAASAPDIKWLRMLLDAGLDPNVQQLGQTPLSSAIYFGRTENEALLRSRGAK
jgi:ankyrin repeat protein